MCKVLQRNQKFNLFVSYSLFHHLVFQSFDIYQYDANLCNSITCGSLAKQEDHCGIKKLIKFLLYLNFRKCCQIELYAYNDLCVM